MGYAYDESPFIPLRTTTSGTTNPDKDAEIARLRAELDAAKADRNERGILALGAVIDRLRSDLSAARRAASPAEPPR